MQEAVQIQNKTNVDVFAVCFPGCISVVIKVGNLRRTGRTDYCEVDFYGL